MLPLATERACQMFTAEQYRAKAAEFRAFLTNTSRSPNETREFRNLEKTYTTLAENEEWMAVHIDKTIQRRKNYDNHAERWSCFLRQAVKVDSAMKRVIHHEDAETVFG